MNINDIVNIINYGSTYSSYSKMFSKFHFKNINNNCPKDRNSSERFRIIGISNHDWDKGNILLGLQSINDPNYQLVVRSTACILRKKYISNINVNIQIL